MIRKFILLNLLLIAAIAAIGMRVHDRWLEARENERWLLRAT